MRPLAPSRTLFGHPESDGSHRIRSSLTLIWSCSVPLDVLHRLWISEEQTNDKDRCGYKKTLHLVLASFTSQHWTWQQNVVISSCEIRDMYRSHTLTVQIMVRLLRIRLDSSLSGWPNRVKLGAAGGGTASDIRRLGFRLDVEGLWDDS